MKGDKRYSITPEESKDFKDQFRKTDILTNAEVDAIAERKNVMRAIIDRSYMEETMLSDYIVLVKSHRAQATRIEELEADAEVVIRRIKAAGVRKITPQQLAQNLEHGIADDD